ncbi:MAG: hypothetical protein WCK15_24965, partial [Pirellula sp.]
SQNYVSGGLHIRGEVAISETCLYFVAYPVHQSLCTPQQNAKKKSPNNSIIYCNRSLGWLKEKKEGKERTGAAIDEIDRFGIIRRLSRF